MRKGYEIGVGVDSRRLQHTVIHAVRRGLKIHVNVWRVKIQEYTPIFTLSQTGV